MDQGQFESYQLHDKDETFERLDATVGYEHIIVKHRGVG
jgi:hypothetical protein